MVSFSCHFPNFIISFWQDRKKMKKEGETEREAIVISRKTKSYKLTYFCHFYWNEVIDISLFYINVLGL